MTMCQWSFAPKSVKDFHSSGFPEWTMKHAFYVDFGGFKLCTRGHFVILINAEELLYLINHKYINYLKLSAQEIEDKNKVDPLDRLILNAQTIWFCATMIAQLVEHLVIIELEVKTAAFVLCSFDTSFFWWHKGAGVSVPATLKTESTMIQIVKDVKDLTVEPSPRTPCSLLAEKNGIDLCTGPTGSTSFE